MAYVTPNSTIQLYKNIPWDNTYDHTLYFQSATTQNAFFTDVINLANTYGLKNLTSYSYQRKGKNSLKVGLQYDDVYDYNYMRFKNTSHENKWFYAFITDVEYVNENTSLIHYEIDVLQTYIDEMVFHNSYVERMHTPTDLIGENLEPEPVDFGDYVNLNNSTPWNFHNYDVILFLAKADSIYIDPGTTVVSAVDDNTVDSDVNIRTIRISVDTSIYQDDDFDWILTNGTQGDIAWNCSPNPSNEEQALLTIHTTSDLFMVPAGALKCRIYSHTYGEKIFKNSNAISVVNNFDIGDTITLDLETS